MILTRQHFLSVRFMHARTAQGFVTAKSGKCICDPINAGPGCCFCVTPGTCGPQLTDAQAQTAYQVSTLSSHPCVGPHTACWAPAAQGLCAGGKVEAPRRERTPGTCGAAHAAFSISITRILELTPGACARRRTRWACTAM